MTSTGAGATMESGSEAVRLTNVDIDNALENNHFQVIFQPIFHLGTGTLLRVESFVRWTHPGLGVLPPGAFISFFESQGRMGELTRHVLTTALDAYIGWRGTEGPGLSVNLAQSDLVEPAFSEWFTGLLRDRKFPAQLITLECPALPADTSLGDATGYFNRLRKTGARMAIEVRGRANDLLRTIDPFPFHELKTGGSAILRFARTMRGGPGLSAISELLELAKANDADIVAVGVEDQASLKALAGLGFTAAQGNFLATIGDLDAVTPEVVARVRETLALPAVGSDELEALMRGEVPGTARSTVTTEDAPGEEAPDDQEVPGASLSPEKIALLKKKAARVAAKRRAERKAASARQATGETLSAEGAAASTTPDEEAVMATETTADDAAAQARRELEEAAARREADENARRLQSRLSQAYASPVPETATSNAGKRENPDIPDAVAVASAEEELPVAASAGNSPATRASGTSSRVTHRAAPTRSETLPDPMPATASASSDAPDKKPARTSKAASSLGFSAITPADEPAGVPQAQPAPQAEDTGTEAFADADIEEAPASEMPEELPADQPDSTDAAGKDDITDADSVQAAPDEEVAAPVSVETDDDTPLPLSRSAMSSGLQLSGIADITHEDLTVSKVPAEEKPAEAESVTELEESEPAADAVSETVATADTSEAPESVPVEEEWTEPDPEEFRSEDEVLDDAFAGATELDPTETHADSDGDQPDGPVELASTEREIAGRLRARRPRRRRNWLMRKHRIWPTHFWPVSWKRKWQELRTEDVEEEDFDEDDAETSTADDHRTDMQGTDSRS